MLARERREQIVALIDERGFVSVRELSDLCGVSEMTTRRDLQQLDEEKRVQRTYGGAIPARAGLPPSPILEDPAQPVLNPEGILLDRVDVLIASSVDPRYDRILLERVEKRNIPIIAESTGVGREETVISVDNYQAGIALGEWAGRFAQQHWAGQALALDLTYQLPNTQARSRGFGAGLLRILPEAQVILSLNGQSRFETAYMLATDALTVHPDINIIFAINDTTARGAIQACQDLGLPPDSVLVVTFGLEGDILKNALMRGEYCKAGLAMFPEIVGPVCVEAAVAACTGQPLAKVLTIPHMILTVETLPQFYRQSDTGWHIRWGAVKENLVIPLDIDRANQADKATCPKHIGFIVPFKEHEWYRNLTSWMQAHAELLGIELEFVDADRSLRGEMDLRKRAIAQVAAEQVQSGDVILIDSGQIMTYLAQELAQRQDLTVITNSIPVFSALKNNPDIALISTGGLLRHSTNTLIGPTALAALRDLRADRLFLVVTGISLDFGLSHNDLTEVAVKQAMINSARQVILMADHTRFGQESMAQVAPTTAVHKLLTDEALPASTRLELVKRGIEVIVARV